MKIYDKNNKLIYECSLKGFALLKEYAKELGCKLILGGGIWTTDKGSLIRDYTNWDSFLDEDTKIIIELAARKYNYIHNGFQIKPFDIIYEHGIVFTELET